ncbi:hypothetical protein P8C59_002976 [Phyllachora maydis]|uniref:Uncharacterized protein n=1 Tax=Phyllachora maydis TaxID=1825666 RepID=A0AAD9I0H9_9PEZI|nr:hypothetical protein P8C59_002976 [Phyllachora maydis]
MRPSTVAASALVLAAAGQAAHAPENTATQQAAVEAPTVAKIDSARFYLSRADKRKRDCDPTDPGCSNNGPGTPDSKCTIL